MSRPRARTRPTLRGYFAVNPANEEQAVERMQDAARSGMYVFVDPGDYGIDPAAPITFDALPTIWGGAGSCRSRFFSLIIGTKVNHPPTTVATNRTLFSLEVGGCGLHDLCVEGDDTVDTTLWPYISDLIRIGGSNVTGRQNHFFFSGLRLLGGAEALNFGRADKVTVRNCYGYHQYDHVLTGTFGQCDYIVDGLHGDHSGQEFIALSNNDDTDGWSAQTNRLLITNFISDRCGCNTLETDFGPTESIDLFIRSALNMTVSNGIITSGGGGGIEIKREDATGLPEQYENLTLDNITFHSAYAASMMTMHWGTPGKLASPYEDTFKNIVFRGLTARYAKGTPATAAAFLVKGQKNVEFQNCTVTGPCGKALQFSSAEYPNAVGRGLKVNGLTANDGVVDGIWISSEHIEELVLSNLDLSVTGSAIVGTTELYADRILIESSYLRTPGTSLMVLSNSVIKDFIVRSSRLACLNYGVFMNAMSAVPTLAALPAVSNCVTSGGLIKVTFAAAHGLVNDDAISITSVVGTTEANGAWLVDVIDAINVTLRDSVFANAYVSGGKSRRATSLLFDAVQFSGTDTAVGPALARVAHDLVTIVNPTCSMRAAKNGRGFMGTATSKYYGRLFRGYTDASPVAAGSLGDFFLGTATAWICTTASTTAATWRAVVA